MTRLISTFVLLAFVVLAAACSPRALSVGAAPGTATATPSASATSSVPSTPKPKPTPSVLALAEAYLLVADPYNHSRDWIVAAANPTWKLSDVRYACRNLATTTDQYVAALAKIPFTTATMKKDAAALIKESKLEAKNFRRCAAAKSITAARNALRAVDNLSASGTAAAMKLRKDLGLPTSGLN